MCSLIQVVSTIGIVEYFPLDLETLATFDGTAIDLGSFAGELAVAELSVAYRSASVSVHVTAS